MKRLLISKVLCCLVLFCAPWPGELLAEDAGAAFFAENARKEGVISLPGGLQYKVLKEGEGRIPKAMDSIRVHYRGTLLDGTEFDNTYTEGDPVGFRVSNTLPGWQQALKKMKEGSKWELYIPVKLGYTTRAARKLGIPGNQPLIYELELLSVTAPTVMTKKNVLTFAGRAAGKGRKAGDTPVQVFFMSEAASDDAQTQPYRQWGAREEEYTFLEENARKHAVVNLPSGLQYRVIRNGTGRSPRPGDRVTVQYRGLLRDGHEFDSSYHGEGAVTLPLDQAIPGWQEALQRMEEGAKWEVYVPPHLAYKKPALLADQTVIFEIELLAVDTPAGAETDVAAAQQGTGSTAEQGNATSDTQTPFASVEPASQAATAAGQAQPRAATSPDLPADHAKQAVISLPSGLQYKVLRGGTGRRPQPTDTLTVRYREQSAAGKESERTVHSEGQATFRLDRAIPGWQAAFAEMEEGARWEFSVPAGLAFSKWGSPDVETPSLEVELLTVSAADASQTAAGGARAFLDANAREAGMISLPGGLQYRVVEEGQGTKPQRGDLVTLRFRGTLLDGRFFDNAYHSEGRETFRLDGAIPGWQDALQRMQEGDTWELYMPSEFAFSEWGPRGGKAVTFEVELVSVEVPRDTQESAARQEPEDVIPEVKTQRSQEDSHAADAEQDRETEFADWRPPASPAEARERAAAFFEENAYREGVMSLPSGLQYKVLKNGSGDVPGPTDTVVVQYRGTLLDGREFGSSDAADGPEQFRVDEVMPGWQEALQRMREGAVWELYVPPRLAHTKGTRKRGTLGFEPLIYQVELVAIAEPQPDEEQSGKATVTSD